MQVAIYARVSTNHQEKNETIESQLELLRAYVKSQKNELSDNHVFIDNGVSGTRLDRPALDRLRDGARWGEFEGVVIASPDRLARSYPHQWLLLEEFAKYGCAVIFLENPYGDSPQGQLLAQMQGMMAEYEHSLIAERTRRGRLHKAHKGEFMPWMSRTYGYRYIPKQGHLPPSIEIDADQAAVVRDMFNWLITEQLSIRQIVKRLNIQKIPTQTRQNTLWHPSSVRNILRNEIYTGQGYYNKTKTESVKKISQGPLIVYRHVQEKVIRPQEEWIAIKAPAIIDQATFQKAQQQLKVNQKKSFRSYRPDSGRYLLRRVVSCGDCGLYMAARRQKSGRNAYLYYSCIGKDPVTVARKQRCPSKLVPADRLDAVVWELVKELIQKPQSLQREYQLWQKIQQNQNGAFSEQLQRIETQSIHLKQQHQRLIDAYQQEVITLKELSTRKEQINLRLKALLQQKRQVISQQKAAIKWDMVVDNIEEFNRIIGKNLDELSFQERQAVTQLLVEKVIVSSDGKVKVYHILPFEEKPVTENQKKKVFSENFYLLRLNHLDNIQHVMITRNRLILHMSTRKGALRFFPLSQGGLDILCSV